MHQSEGLPDDSLDMEERVVCFLLGGCESWFMLY